MACFARSGSEALKHKKQGVGGEAEGTGEVVWRHAEVNNKTCRESELTLAGEGLRGDWSMMCFLEGVPSTAPFWSLASMVVDYCCPGGC